MKRLFSYVILVLILTSCGQNAVVNPDISEQKGDVHTITGWKSFRNCAEFDRYYCEIWDRRELSSRDSCQIFYNDGYFYSADLAPFNGNLSAVFSTPQMQSWGSFMEATPNDTIVINMQYHDINIIWFIRIIASGPTYAKFELLLRL